MNSEAKDLSDASAHAADPKREFIANYVHAGHDWTLTFYAADPADAERKIASIRRTLTLDGELAMTIRLPWFRLNVAKWFKNTRP